jgi:hypothetical protein
MCLDGRLNPSNTVRPSPGIKRSRRIADMMAVWGPLRSHTIAERAEGIQQVGDESLLVVVVYFLTHRHEH